MADISTHLHHRPYQMAISKDRLLERRKWDHKGTIWAPSARSAAFKLAGDLGLGEMSEEGGVLKFGGWHVRVDFGR